MAGPGLVARSPRRLSSAAPGTSFSLAVTTHANQTESAAEWHRQLRAAHASAPLAKASLDGRLDRHTAGWSDFWARSYIIIDGDTGTTDGDGFVVTQQYAVCRYLQAIQAGTWVCG